MTRVLTPNQRAHRGLADYRLVDRYLRAIEAPPRSPERAQLRELEPHVIKVLKRFAKRKGIERETFKEFGVKEAVLKKAGM